MPQTNVVSLMKQSRGIEIAEIEFEIGVESSLRKEGGEFESCGGSDCNIQDS